MKLNITETEKELIIAALSFAQSNFNDGFKERLINHEINEEDADACFESLMEKLY